MSRYPAPATRMPPASAAAQAGSPMAVSARTMAATIASKPPYATKATANDEADTLTESRHLFGQLGPGELDLLVNERADFS